MVRLDTPKAIRKDKVAAELNMMERICRGRWG